MSKEKREKPEIITTPKGELVGFNAIQTAATNFVADGVFQANIAFDPEVIAPIVKKLEKIRDDHFAEVTADVKPALLKKYNKVAVFKNEEDEDGEETGRVILKVKQKKVIRYKDKKSGEEKSFTKVVPVRDAKAVLVKKDIKIGAGTIAKIAFEASPYFSAKDKDVGVTLRFEGIQVFKLVQYNGGMGVPSAEDHGFEAEDDEDAFSADEFDSEEDEDEDDSSDASEDEDEVDDEITF